MLRDGLLIHTKKDVMANEKEPLEVFNGSNWEAEMVKSLLENEGITGYLLNEAGTVFPFDVTELGTGAVRVMVADTDYDEAKTVVLVIG
jgi:Putative prokaryotic signal transducing protein